MVRQSGARRGCALRSRNAPRKAGSACCLRCNNVKSDKTPHEMGWSLRFQPKAPHGVGWVVRGVERPQAEWDEFLAAA